METDLVSQRARLAQFSEPGAAGLDDLERELKPAGLGRCRFRPDLVGNVSRHLRRSTASGQQ
jgi:hypothetical protein